MSLISVSDDVDLARRELKLQMAFYATTRTYMKILDRHEKAAIVPELRDAFSRRDKQTMIDLIDDELMDAITSSR